MRPPRLLALLPRALLALVVGGCGGASDPINPPADPPCDDALAVALADGSCFRPGVSADGCGEGFVHDGGYGCEPILPSEPCPPGLMAVPGDDACRAVMDCGSGKWGNLPVDGATHYVDVSYLGTDSDGSEAKPWRTINDAIAALPANGLVAVAAGVYSETIALKDKPARVWGVCPDLVTIISPGPAPNCPAAGACIADGASGSEIGGMAMTGPFTGVVMSGSEDVLIDRVRVFDVGFRGVAAEAALGPTSFTLRDSLIEGATEFGVWTNGASPTIEGTVIRDSRPRPSDQQSGTGVYIQTFCTTPNQCDATVPVAGSIHRSVIDRNHESGLTLAGTSVTVTDTVIRLTLPRASPAWFGRGIEVLACTGVFGCIPSVGANLTASGLLIERNVEAGIVIMGSQATIDRSVIRDTLPDQESQVRGFGVAVQPSCNDVNGALVCDDQVRANLLLTASLLARSHEIGVAVTAADGIVDGCVVQDVAASVVDQLFGDGISVATRILPATARVSRSLVEASARVGVGTFGARVELSETDIRCAPLDLNGDESDGLPFELLDAGGNACGCPLADRACQLVSAGLEPPNPLGPSTP